jgi:hypothetical protein
MRWSKSESHFRDLIRERKDAIKKIFQANPRGATTAHSADPVEALGTALSFNDFKGGLRGAGVRLSDMDFEMLWRRVDAECVGEVKYENVAHAFDLTDRRSLGEPGGSRALPHFKQDVPEQQELPLERASAEFASSLAAERIARAIVGAPVPYSTHTWNSINHEGGRHHFTNSTNPPQSKAKNQTRVWHVVRETLHRHPQHLPLDADVLHRALNAAGALVSKADSAELWQRARIAAVKRSGRTGADLSPGVEDLQAVLTAAAHVQMPEKDRPLLSYGSPLGRASSADPGARRGGYAIDAADGGHQSSEGADAQPRALDAAASDALSKLSAGFLGNPHRLRQVFKKYDLDRQGTVSRREFERGLAEQWTALSQQDVETLSAAVQDTSGIVHYESFCHLVAAQSSARPSGLTNAGTTGHGTKVPEGDWFTHRTYSLDDSHVSHFNVRAEVHSRASPRGACGSTRGADSPRAAARPRSASVQRERSTSSVRSHMSSAAASSSADRSTWLQTQHSAERQPRIIRSSSPAPSSSRAGTPQRASSPCADAAEQRNVHFVGAGAGGARVPPPAVFRILHLAEAPPIAITRPIHHRSLAG